MRVRVAVGAGLVLGAFAVVAVVAYFGNRELYLTVDELVADRALYPSEATGPQSAGPARMQVRGTVDDATVSRSADGLDLRFVLLGQASRLPVSYHGLVPDAFEAADTITVGGVVGPDGTFDADTVTVQCPSKYAAALPGTASPPAGTAQAPNASGALR
jgi:cytochrome c-type biogenesis protein CcmE